MDWDKRVEQAKKSAAVTKFRQAKLEKWFTKKNTLPFFNSNRDKIAIAQKLDDGKIKVTYYGNDGPHGDFTCKLARLADELRGYSLIPIVNFAAQITLEQWGSTETWSYGLKQLRFVALVNCLPWKDSKPMYKMSLDKALVYGNKKALELGIEVY